MKKLENEFKAREVIASIFGRARQPTRQSMAVEPEELTLAEISVVAGGPESEVGGGVAPH